MTSSDHALRVMHLNTARTWRGGERQVLLLARGLGERGHANLLVCQPGSRLAVQARREAVPVREMAVRGEWDLVACARLAGLAREFRADLCHLHTAHAHTVGLLAGLWGRMPPRVVSRRVDFRPRANPLSVLKYRWPGQAYIAVSENVRRVLISAGVHPERVRTIYSGIPGTVGARDSDGDGAVDLGIEPEKRIVVSVAALAPHKDPVTLLRAARRVVDQMPDVHFLLLGEGPLARRVRREVETLRLGGNVTVAGFRDDVKAILSRSCVFVSSSWLEGLGTSLLDAMAAGLPVVATRVGGIPEIVRHDREGILVPPRNPQALAEALMTVLRSGGRARAFGEAGRVRAGEFDIARTVRETERFYRDVLRSRGVVV